MFAVKRHPARLVAFAAVIACWAGTLVSVWFRVDGYQWDFKTYYYASQAIERGLNPYNVSDLVAVAGEGSNPLRYVYPLHALNIFKPLAELSYPTAHRIWLGLKLALTVGLLFLWKKYFARDIPWPWLVAFALFAFQGATLWDLKAGNVSTLEQVFLWGAFASLVRGRTFLFALLVTTAAFFKLSLIVFLFLLFLPCVSRGRQGFLLVAGHLILLASVTLLSFADHPDYFGDFVSAARSTPAWLHSNPSAFGAAVELTRRSPNLLGGSPAVPYLLWIAYCLVLLIPGRRLLLDAWRSTSPSLPIMVACLCYALIVPRFMVYSYMIVIVPVLTILLSVVHEKPYGSYVLAVLICIDGLQVLPADIGKVLSDCKPWLLLVFCWLLLVAYYQSTKKLALYGQRC